MLLVATFAQAAGAVVIHGPAFLIPVLHARAGLSLPEAGLVAAAPTVGVMLTLVPWGALVDRTGERLVLLAGLGGTALAGAAAVAVAASDAAGLVGLAGCLGAAGACAASTNSASGRIVVGWFPPEQRGLAMGVRQMGQPVGVGVGAIGIAVVADRHGIAAALGVPLALAVVALGLVALVVLDPPRRAVATGETPANPYRGDRYLVRIHAASVLLVVPQFVVWTFALVWLVDGRGWSAGAAGALVGVSQVLGALGRIGVGGLSDAVRSRMRPLRWVCVAGALLMAALGLAAGLELAVGVPVLVAAAVVTVAPNGLAFTGVAERAGSSWSGRALGVQNTAQFLAASAVPPLAGLAVAHGGYGVAFGASALFPLLALGLVPARQEEPLG